VFADHHPAHEAKAVEQWLEGRESEIERRWLPCYSPELNPDEFLNNNLKQTYRSRKFDVKSKITLSSGHE
jgi:transposase